MPRRNTHTMRVCLCQDERELIRIALFEYVYYEHFTDEREKELALAIRSKIERASNRTWSY